MRKKTCVCILLVLAGFAACMNAAAQDARQNSAASEQGSSVSGQGSSATGQGISSPGQSGQARQLPGRATAYQIPQTVYVGDRAALVVPLPDAAVVPDIDISPLPLSPNGIEFHRIALESRSPGRAASGGAMSGGRLIIEFTAFAPGRFEIPPFEAGGMRFAGLQLDIHSILTGDRQPVLSSLTAPLSIPGTGILIYGVLAVLVILAGIAVWVSVWGKKYISVWFAVWKKQRLIRLMLQIERRMRKDLIPEKSGEPVLDAVSVEFRNFLSLFTGENCRAMTPVEFNLLQERCLSGSHADWSSCFLEDFFRRCDSSRFSGREAGDGVIRNLLDELRNFLLALYRSVKENSKKGKQGA
ncbi:MAG: hypothetical protein FWF29_06375 [Treponema sp.]|nr:hypothetical protein [Treponema sp.]